MSKITHKTIYTTTYWNDKTDHKVFDYNDGVDLTKKQFDLSFVVNVPCYKVEDVTQAIDGRKSNYFCSNKLSKLTNNLVTIQTQNHRGKQYNYILATDEVVEFVKQQVTFGAIKGNISKMPKKHTKTVRIFNRGKHGINNLVKVDCYIQEEYLNKHLTEQVKI